jgi:uncharacterized membrane protein YdfJ with MMPL/SSD domain
MFTWLGRFAYRHRRWVLIVAGLFVVLAAVWGGGVFGALGSGGYTSPDIEANRANTLLDQEFGHAAGTVDAVAVFVDESKRTTVDDPAFRQQVTEAIGRLPGADVKSASSYYTPGLSDAERALLVSKDRHATEVSLTLQGIDDASRLKSYGDIQTSVRATGGLKTYLGGGFTSEYQLQQLATANLATSQEIALPILLVLLVIMFRGVVAGALPVLLGVFAILGALVLLRLLTFVTDLSIFALEITTLLGLGLAIDYGLFIVSRFREELERRDGDVGEAVAAAMATAGRTVAFSGLTVVIGLCALLLFPEPISHSFGLGGVAVVLFNIIAALTVMPAILGVLGRRVNALRVPWPRRRGVDAESGGWARLARAIMRRPVAWLVASVVILLAAAAPLLTVQPGLTNHRYLPLSNEGQIVANMTDNDFPDGGPGRVTIDIAVVGGVSDGALNDYVHRLSELKGVTSAGVHLKDAKVTWVALGYHGEADDPANLQLVKDVRAQAPPAGTAQLLVGGQGGPALSLDANNDTVDSLPPALIFVAIATLLLLFLAFGSVIVPLQALVIAFLSLTASLGVVIWGFQNGGLAGLMGFHVVGTTDLWTLGLIITIAFGLVTDYEMFLVSRAREEFLATGDNERSVAVGLQHTGSIITRAAVLMIVVLAAMGFSSTSLFLQTLGVGLTLSVVIDAVLVRSILVPAAMRLFGRANWWAPAPLRRLSDRVGLSETAPRPPASRPVEQDRAQVG